MTTNRNKTMSTPARASRPKAELMAVTPEMAKAWLAETNTHNRSLRHSAVAAYARDMGAGRWRTSGEAIKFAADGTLLDGQHRLAAIVRAGVTVSTFVVFGLRRDAQDVMDSGRKRSAGDALQLSGMRNVGRVAAAARLALSRRDNHPLGGGGYTNAEVQQFVRDNPDLAEAVELMGSTVRGLRLTPRVGDYCFWLFSRLDPDAAYEFFTSLGQLVGLTEGNPILTLHRRLSGHYGAARRISVEEQLSLVIRAWNHWRQGTTVHKLLSISRSGTVAIPDPI
ncbi:hypothetical protein [Actinokineospora iranica]|uniref:Uncharacterized protein n=1 Tax=Actinokineospora iranica TaxID=1271860 RepID=A0A1G6K2D3_9PSEU|nr:hypothetical protein [Actinokineospora iranica]SDC25134.1 hypothetical protein SAMN05216174_101679 [Actinokineospora iranica]